MHVVFSIVILGDMSNACFSCTGAVLCTGLSCNDGVQHPGHTRLYRCVPISLTKHGGGDP
eukprot:5583566-Heterocapsa_arctica.AAC.1